MKNKINGNAITLTDDIILHQSALSDEDFGKPVKAVMAFALDSAVPELEGALMNVWRKTRPEILPVV